ncbi:hypothetical protein [Mycolicibacterium gadium]|uniref:Uncharacterized protein n=1 Tax=Mycolicibacterium gadium TaxID=1794 RepID=A0ABT6GVR5_MYCGU|nr:hypothetical protein [Mycolicibacterium gadium]
MRTTQTPFLETYEDVRVECAAAGEGLQHRYIVPIRGSARQFRGDRRRGDPRVGAVSTRTSRLPTGSLAPPWMMEG